MRAAIAGTQGYSGVTGTIGFDQNGDNAAKIVSLYEDVSTDATADWKYIKAFDFGANPLT